MNLSHYKVGSRLAFAFGLLLTLSLMSALMALRGLSGIQANLNGVVNDNNVRIKLNTEMAEAVYVVARGVRSILLLQDQAEKTKEMDKIVKARGSYDQAWDALQKHPPSERGKGMRAEIDAAKKVTRSLVDQVLTLVMAEKNQEATTLLMTQVSPAGKHWLEAIEQNRTQQEQTNETQYQASLADYQLSRNILIGANILSVLAAAVVGWLVTRSITGQLGAEPNEAVELAQRVAQGDLGSRIHLKQGDTSSLMAQLKQMQDSLSKVVGAVRQNADSVATASSQIAQGNLDLSQRTEEQAAALEQTASSMEELGSNVSHNADNARHAAELAQGASDVASRGGNVVSQVVDTMTAINDSSKKIADIIGVIDGIAFQTNILALNAAVEAARAGEQGRGFAVVAGEVRSLAQRSADAAKEIKGLISTSVERVAQGSALVDQARSTMTEIVSSIQRVSDIMGEINSASAEQSSGVSQVGQAVSQMDQATQQNAALVEESAAAAASLKSQANELVQIVAVFKLA